MRKILYIICFMPSLLFANDYKALISIDMDSGKVLYSENANDSNYPASLTKLMTIYLVFDALENGVLTKDQNLIVSESASKKPETKLGLKPGQKISVDTAIKALIIRSANDVATVLSENLIGDEGDFSDLMTKAAKGIGLSKTNFENASGLPDYDQTSTARDLALLSLAIYKHFPEQFYYFKQQSFDYNGKTYYGHNNILNTYSGATGMKTGWTVKSGYNLVATADKNGQKVMSVVLGSPDLESRLKTSIRLLDYSYDILNNGKIPEFSDYKSNKKLINTPVSIKKDNKNFIPGNYIVQMGAFSSEQAAKNQIDFIYNLFGVYPSIDSEKGLFKVRAKKLNKNKADDILKKCTSNNVGCFLVK